MEEAFDRSLCNALATVIRQQITTPPDVGIILGSGLSAVAEQVVDPVVIPYHTLPAWPRSAVEGHKGELIIGDWANHTVIILNGRAHYYQGYSMAELALPVRVLRTMGVTRLIVTNAAGGLEPGFRVGDLMLITDHLNLIGMAGLSPLRGPNDPTLGPRFPDMSQVYDPALQNLARSVAKSKGLFLREGVYVMVAGPAYETPADIRFLRLIGADAVGMSTVPEVIAARHAGMAVLGLSGITNVARFTLGAEKTTHEDVLAAGLAIGPRMRDLIGGVLERL